MDNRFEQQVLAAKRQPNFENLLKVLRRERPDRPTLFEFIINDRMIDQLVGAPFAEEGMFAYARHSIAGFCQAGYDYYPLGAWYVGFSFPREAHTKASSVSLNEGGILTSRTAFDAYPWPEPDALDYSILDTLGGEMPEGMKLISWGPGGVLENVIELVGFENLCFMLIDEPDLVQDLFDAVGSRLLRYYERCLEHDAVGAIISNDDWGFKTQTMLAPADMRKYVIPWHRKIVAAAHAGGRPAILHSCGNLEAVMDDIIDDIGFDAKHSYEDAILPVEEAYDRWGGRIAVLGGIDVDFICRSTPQEVYDRSKAMFARSADRGGYALGTGNSVPEYVPADNYFAMIAAGLE